jgi:hypothetical protein
LDVWSDEREGLGGSTRPVGLSWKLSRSVKSDTVEIRLKALEPVAERRGCRGGCGLGG